MFLFCDPRELNTILENERRPVLIACLSESSAASQMDIINRIFPRYENRMKICLIDTDYLEFIGDKFDVRGTPSFILCFKGKNKNLFLGHADSEEM